MLRTPRLTSTDARDAAASVARARVFIVVEKKFHTRDITRDGYTPLRDLSVPFHRPLPLASIRARTRSVYVACTSGVPRVVNLLGRETLGGFINYGVRQSPDAVRQSFRGGCWAPRELRGRAGLACSPDTISAMNGRFSP